MSVRPAAMRRLMRELTELKKSPPEGIRIVTSDDNMLDVTGIIQGPEGTPYAGGYFKVKFSFTEEFPAAPPKCWFATKIFHPNVSTAGEICVNTLKKDWQSSYGVGHILVTVKCLLIYPNPESALDEEAGKLLLENYESYCDRAKLITSVHATPRVPPPEFATSSGPASSGPSTSTSSILPIPSSIASSASIPIFVPHNPQTKSVASTTTSQPLKSSVANGLPILGPVNSLSGEKDKSRDKERHVSPSPLSTADSNVGGGMGQNATAAAPVAGTTKAVKRSAGAAGATNMEKRKKALKRL